MTDANEILKKTFRFPAKKAIKNIFIWATQEGLEFQTMSKYVFYRPHCDLKQKIISHTSLSRLIINCWGAHLGSYQSVAPRGQGHTRKF